jgi:hypothetical protein
LSLAVVDAAADAAAVPSSFASNAVGAGTDYDDDTP